MSTAHTALAAAWLAPLVPLVACGAAERADAPRAPIAAASVDHNLAARHAPVDGSARSAPSAPSDAGPTVIALPLHLVVPTPAPGDRVSPFDLNRGPFAAPDGAFALVHQADGSVETVHLGKATAGCLRGRGTLRAHVALEPRADAGTVTRVTDRVGDTATVDCAVERARRDPAWPKVTDEPVTVEVIVIAR